MVSKKKTVLDRVKVVQYMKLAKEYRQSHSSGRGIPHMQMKDLNQIIVQYKWSKSP